MPFTTYQYKACILVIEDPAKAGSGETLREIPFDIEDLAKNWAPLQKLFQKVDSTLSYELRPCPDLGGGFKGNLENYMNGKTYNLVYDGQFIGYDLYNGGEVGGDMLYDDVPKIHVKWKFVSDFEKSMTASTYKRHSNNGHYGF